MKPVKSKIHAYFVSSMDIEISVSAMVKLSQFGSVEIRVGAVRFINGSPQASSDRSSPERKRGSTTPLRCNHQRLFYRAADRYCNVWIHW